MSVEGVVRSGLPEYPHLQRFSRDIGVPEERLVRAFEIEREFHGRILAEPDPEERRRLYRQVYETVHALYGSDCGASSTASAGKDRFVRLFRRELEGRSILDVGCGEGHFLLSVKRLLRHGSLAGIDTSAAVLPKDVGGIRFVHGDIIDFDLGERFDIVFSDNVLEHLAPQDVPAHLDSVRRALEPGGTFIVLTPSRLFGPCDVTRIIDYTYTGRVRAQGTHLMETSYTELVDRLAAHGFRDFSTVLPIPKLKFILSWMRVPLAPLRFVERHPALLGLIHGVRLRGRCILRLDVTLICRAA